MEGQNEAPDAGADRWPCCWPSSGGEAALVRRSVEQKSRHSPSRAIDSPDSPAEAEGDHKQGKRRRRPSEQACRWGRTAGTATAPDPIAADLATDLRPGRRVTSGRQPQARARAAPGALSSATPPPWSSAILLTRARPRPLPLVLVEKNGSNMRSRTSGSIPGPVSSTSISTRRPASAAPQPDAIAPRSPTACSAFSTEVHDRALEQAPVRPSPPGRPAFSSRLQRHTRAAAPA